MPVLKPIARGIPEIVLCRIFIVYTPYRIPSTVYNRPYAIYYLPYVMKDPYVHVIPGFQEAKPSQAVVADAAIWLRAGRACKP